MFGFHVSFRTRGQGVCIICSKVLWGWLYILCFCFNLPFFMFILKALFSRLFSFARIDLVWLPGWAGTLGCKMIDVDVHLLPPWSKKPMSYFSGLTPPKRPSRGRPFLPNVRPSLWIPAGCRGHVCQPAVLDVKDEGKKHMSHQKKILVGWVIVGDDISYPVI